MSKKYEVNINGIRFSSQEMAIVEELKKGATYREIAEKLSISVKAIDYHVKNLKEKTGLVVTPGINYGNSGEGYIRLNIATPRKNLIDACSRLMNKKKKKVEK